MAWFAIDRHAWGCLLALAPAADGSDVSDLFEQVQGAVVLVKTEERIDLGTGFAPAPAAASVPGLGSGVLISGDGAVMTAAHVVQTAEWVSVEFAGGEEVPARVVSSVPFADVALLRLEWVPPSAVAVPLGDSDAVRVGEEVLVVGAPYGFGHTLTVGHVSARRHAEREFGRPAEFLQTDAAINEGNSGSPVFNLRGEVIGLVA